MNKIPEKLIPTEIILQSNLYEVYATNIATELSNYKYIIVEHNKDLGTQRHFHIIVFDYLTCLEVHDFLFTINQIVYVYYVRRFDTKGDYWQNQVSSCYFSLPSSFWGSDYYGNLQEITAEFYNYYTTPIMITNNSQIAYKVSSVANCFASDETINALKNYYKLSALGVSVPAVSDTRHYAFGFNHTGTGVCDLDIDFINWSYFGDINATDGDSLCSGSEMIETYRTYFNGKADRFATEEEKIANLFVSKYLYTTQNYNLSGFNYGYNKHTYSISEKSNSTEVTEYEIKDLITNNFFYNLFNIRQGESKQLLPIVKVNVDDLMISTDEFSAKYYVAKSEVPVLKKYVSSRSVLMQDTFIFRYDCSEYYCAPGTVSCKVVSDYVTSDCFIAMQPYYKDFDILSFGFNQNGDIVTIPVIHSPEDVTHDPTAPIGLPDADWSWLLRLIAIVLGALLLIALFPLILSVFQFVIYIILFPFKLIGSVFKITKNSKRYKKK